MSEAKDVPAEPKPKLRWPQFSLRMLLLFVTVWAILCSMLLTFWIYVVSPAREAGRPATCINELHDYSHACGGEVICLTPDMRVASVSACPICCQMDHPWSEGTIRFVDSKGMPVDERAVPPKTVEDAKVRLRENRQKLKGHIRDTNTAKPQSGSPPGGTSRGKAVE